MSGFGWGLPPGVTNQDIDKYFGEIDMTYSIYFYVPSKNGNRWQIDTETYNSLDDALEDARFWEAKGKHCRVVFHDPDMGNMLQYETLGGDYD